MENKICEQCYECKYLNSDEQPKGFEEINKTIGETIIRDKRLLKYCAYVQAINYIVDKKFAEVAKNKE